MRLINRIRPLLKVCALAVIVGGATMACSKKGATDSKSTQAEAEIPALTIDEVAAGIEQKTLMVFDNNSENRFKKGHVPTAKWLAFNDVKASDLPANKDQKLVFYCANEH
jgi:hypothetical protein